MLQLDHDERVALLRLGILKTIIFTALSLFCILLVLYGDDYGVVTIVLVASIIVGGMIACLVVMPVLKLRSLRLTEISTSFSTKETRDILAKFAKLYGWKVENNRNTLIVLIARPSDRYSYSRSERIMLLIEDGRIWASSICNPNGPFRFRSLINGNRNLNLVREMLSGTRIPNVELKKKKRKGAARLSDN